MTDVEIVIHPDAIGVSGGAYRPPPEPKSQLHSWKGIKHIEVCYECERAFPAVTRCKRCDLDRKGHNAEQRAAQREIARRRGKVESTCSVCDGSGQYTDERGRNPFFSCRRCRGWGRVWRAKPKRSRR